LGVCTIQPSVDKVKKLVFYARGFGEFDREVANDPNKGTLDEFSTNAFYSRQPNLFAEYTIFP